MVLKLQDDVYRKSQLEKRSTQLIKLAGKDVVYNASLIASEIIDLIDGYRTSTEILNIVVGSYDSCYENEIRSKGKELFEHLLKEQLLMEV